MTCTLCKVDGVLVAPTDNKTGEKKKNDDKKRHWVPQPLDSMSARIPKESSPLNLDKEEGATEYGSVVAISSFASLCQRAYGSQVVKSSPKYAQTARDEIALLNQISNIPNPNHPDRAHLVQFLNSFELKPDGGIPGSSTIYVTDYRHVCMIFEPLGGNVLTLRCLHWCDETNLKRFLHQDCELIHMDLKPENVMVVVDDVEELVGEDHAVRELVLAVGTADMLGLPLGRW
ncbi:hypothetical protein BS47DRAFT_1387624 [Hydnum rufescens UP504]|uniref:non-specific serine/threonine protein kinase n=1 Tax=Hydnum rufescens UP504 TaxID=1448309 RepID=A0A9P6B9K4_9AGAM|nr:hypothetical protein BS47DRAFT_1387624 [Hydnum rufescens UP504]